MVNISGIYCIENTINGKKYIGSSNNIAYRFKKHLCELKNQRHKNKHLQASANKYGLENFKFYILEECSITNLIIKEQYYIDSFNFNNLYNKTKYSSGGGGDLTSKDYYLLDLSGNIIDKFKSGISLAKFLKQSSLNYSGVNTDAISKRMYRIATPEFYNTNKELILSWRPYSNEIEYKKQFKKSVGRPRTSNSRYPQCKITKNYFNKILRQKIR